MVCLETKDQQEEKEIQKKNLELQWHPSHLHTAQIRLRLKKVFY